MESEFDRETRGDVVRRAMMERKLRLKLCSDS